MSVGRSGVDGSRFKPTSITPLDSIDATLHRPPPIPATAPARAAADWSAISSTSRSFFVMRTGSHRHFVHVARRLIELLFHLRQRFAKLAELVLHRREQIPDFTRSLLNGERPKSHLQTVQQRRQRRRPRKYDPAFALHLLHQTNPPDRFRVESFRRQEHEREVSRSRRIDIFRANIFRALSSIAFRDSSHRGFHRRQVAFVLRRDAGADNLRLEISHRSAARPARHFRRPAV